MTITMQSHLEFENGMLVKVDGRRYNYMSGDELLALVRVLGKHLHEARRIEHQTFKDAAEINRQMEKYNGHEYASEGSADAGQAD